MDAIWDARWPDRKEQEDRKGKGKGKEVGVSGMHIAFQASDMAEVIEFWDEGLYVFSPSSHSVFSCVPLPYLSLSDKKEKPN